MIKIKITFIITVIYFHLIIEYILSYCEIISVACCNLSGNSISTTLHYYSDTFWYKIKGTKSIFFCH